MPMNCKPSGSSCISRVTVYSKLRLPNRPFNACAWKWRKLLIQSLWVMGFMIGLLWFILSFEDGVWQGKKENPLSMFWEGNGVFLLQQFRFNLDKLLLPIASLFSDQRVWQAIVVKENEKLNCMRFSSCVIIICWWLLLGVIAGYKIFSFHVNLWKYEMDKPIQEQPLLPQQQKQLLQQTQKELAKCYKGTGKWRMKLLVLYAFFSMAFAVWLFFHLKNNTLMSRKEALINMCDQRARMLQDQFNVSMNHVHSLALLVSTFHHGKHVSAIDRKTFEEYTKRTAFERPLTSGVGYALRVLHSEREQFEKQQGWKIKKMEIEDQTLVQDCTMENLDPSPVHDEYAPVIFSQETVSHIVSIDMMSGKEDRENILRARASGKGALTSPLQLLKSNHLGVVLTFAVYKSDLPRDATVDQRIQATVGYLGASYDVPALVEKLLHQLASKETIIVNVYDTTNASAPINMYGAEEVIDTGLSHVNHIDFGDPSRKHEMHCRFKEKPPPPLMAIGASIGVLVISFLVGYIFLAAINRITKVEHDFQKMMELKSRAEAADVAKSQFLATVSHELRTPMNGVLGMLQMLMDTDLDEMQKDFAQTAHDSGNDLISVINEVLDQAKIESGRLELDVVPFDLRGILDQIFSLFYGKCIDKGIQLAVYVSEQLPEVVIGDPVRFRQIIANLVGNSIKFTCNKGHIFVSVHLADEVKDQLDVSDEVLRHSLIMVQDRTSITNSTLSGLPVVDRWKSWENFKKLNDTTSADGPELIKLLITVEDTGIGICHDAQGRIFTPFMQADSSTSRKYGGTGIGLSVSKCLVDLMCGEIGFVSEPGTGSTFSFTTTLKKGERSSLDTKSHAFDPVGKVFLGLRALVVDERKIQVAVIKYQLQRLGIYVDSVSSLACACSYLLSSGITSSTQLAMIVIDEGVWHKDTDLAFQHLVQELKLNGSINSPYKLLKIFLLSSSVEIKSTVVDCVLLKPLRLRQLLAYFQGSLETGKRRELSGCKPTLVDLLKQKRILVVDDNTVNQRVAQSALRKYGAIVTCVGSGKDALESLKPPHRFDVCFMDLQMPEMNGFQATQKIRCMENEINEKIESEGESRDVTYWHTPILAMTADVIQSTNELCMKYGMDGYVSKPFEEEQLYSAVVRFF